jgi:hypothetical protein
MERRPVVLIHGYSDNAESFRAWHEGLVARGYDGAEIHTCSYQTLTNEVTIKDIAEGFDRALRIRTGLGDTQDFDAIVHSTGMLVIRAWLTNYERRQHRLKHLIGLAPATFGSPLAHKGRSWLGAVFKGNRDVESPDFLEAGDRVLDALELGSRYTWDLAHLDLVGDTPVYGPDADTPYVFIFCGTRGYGGIRQLVNKPGTDGTVRWAGCALNARKFILDLTKDPSLTTAAERAKPVPPPVKEFDIPFIPVVDATHGQVLREPSDTLIDRVFEALGVEDAQGLAQWYLDTQAMRDAAQHQLAEGGTWQQFIVRAVDERGDPITDYNVQLFGGRDGTLDPLGAFDTDVQTYSGDASLRCFHLNLDNFDHANLEDLWLHLIASSGSRLVRYYGSAQGLQAADGGDGDGAGTWDAQINLGHLLRGNETRLFSPYTTTLIELRLNREPTPLGMVKNDVCYFPAEE